MRNGIAVLAASLSIATPSCGGHRADAGMTDDFSDAERWAARFEGPDRDGWQRPQEVIALMEIAPGSTAADLGAGTGYFLPHLSRAVGPSGRVLALDIAQSLVDYMNERAEREGLDNATAVLVAPDDPGLAPGSVDRILIVNTWHHIEDREAYASRLREALAPGGAVFVVDFTLETDKGPPAKHKISERDVAAELEAGGLSAEVLEESLPDQYAVVGRLP